MSHRMIVGGGGKAVSVTHIFNERARVQLFDELGRAQDAHTPGNSNTILVALN